MNTPRRVIGHVVSATWIEEAQAVRVELAFEGTSQRLRGMIHSGSDAASGRFIDPARLRAAAARLVGMVVQDTSGRLDPAKLGDEHWKRLQIRVSLDNLSIGVGLPSYEPDANSYLRGLFG